MKSLTCVSKFAGDGALLRTTRDLKVSFTWALTRRNHRKVQSLRSGSFGEGIVVLGPFATDSDVTGNRCVRAKLEPPHAGWIARLE